MGRTGMSAHIIQFDHAKELRDKDLSTCKFVLSLMETPDGRIWATVDYDKPAAIENLVADLERLAFWEAFQQDPWPVATFRLMADGNTTTRWNDKAVKPTPDQIRWIRECLDDAIKAMEKAHD